MKERYCKLMEEIESLEAMLKDIKAQALKLSLEVHKNPYGYMYELLDAMFDYCDNEELEGIAYTYVYKGTYIAIRLEEIFKDKGLRKHFVDKLMKFNRMDTDIRPSVVSFKGKSKRCYIMSLETYEKLKMYSSEMIE